LEVSGRKGIEKRVGGACKDWDLGHKREVLNGVFDL
jgi:hypothetical protein